jgi:hypothetical protein
LDYFLFGDVFAALIFLGSKVPKVGLRMGDTGEGAENSCSQLLEFLCLKAKLCMYFCFQFLFTMH